METSISSSVIFAVALDTEEELLSVAVRTCKKVIPGAWFGGRNLDPAVPGPGRYRVREDSYAHYTGTVLSRKWS